MRMRAISYSGPASISSGSIRQYKAEASTIDTITEKLAVISMADDAPKITVSYNGREKRIPLVVQPSLELNDCEVDQAELELCGIVRHVFSIPAEADFTLHEAETSRILTKESFRDPSYIRIFPKYWYLTVEKTATEAGEEEDEDKAYDTSSGCYDLYGDSYSDLEVTLPSLAELSLDVKYQTVRLRAESSGLFGVTLRYFSIQPITGSARADSPSNQPLYGDDSQNSQHSSSSADVLSTTFVHEVEGVGQEAGLRRGDTVHMIDGESIIRSSFAEIEDLLAQCGNEITLMVLPKEHDDLQFIYPQYTEGSVGEYTSGDERVIARDIPIVVGSGTNLPVEPGTLSPPVEGGRGPGTRGTPVEGGRGPLTLYRFNGSGSSLDHTHSNSSSEHIHQTADDRLVICSIHDIPVPSPTKSYGWSRSGTGSNSQLDKLEENELYVTSSWKGVEPVANGDLRYEYQSEEQAWYQDPPDDIPVKARVVRAHSQDSAVVHRVGLQSMSEEDQGSFSQPMWAEDLGVVRINRHSKKSLEMLTSLSTAPQPTRGMRRIRSDDVIGKQRAQMESEIGIRRHSEQNRDSTPTEPADSYKVDNVSPLPASRQGSGVRQRKAARSYSRQRPQLNKSRSRISDSEAAAKTAESLRKQMSQPAVGEKTEQWVRPAELGERGKRRAGQGEKGEDSRHERYHSESGTAHHLPPPPLMNVSSEERREEEEDRLVATPTLQVPMEEEHGGRRERGERGGGGGERRGGSLKHGAVSPPMSPSRFQSATLDPRLSRPPAPGDHNRHLIPSVDVSALHPSLIRDHMFGQLKGSGSRRLPIAKTRSAQTPYGTEVVQERDIDAAVAASQSGATSLSVQHGTSHSFSVDTEGVIGDVGVRGSQGVGLFPPTISTRRLSLPYEERSSVTSVPCHGLLYKKQVSEGLSKRGGTRSWRPFYTVLVGSHMVFYKDKRDADANKPCEEPPVEVVPGRADLTHGYTKRRFVFRVICGHGAEYLLQCEDSQSMLHWVTAIHRLNGGGKMVEQSAPAKLDPRQMLTPGSPISSRRESSPLPMGSQRSTRRRGLVSGLKSALQRGKNRGTSPPSFGQLLADCPMSTDNKWVPLVVELCVREIEEQGLDVEGLYRKPGQSSSIRNMVSEIDRGQFEFEAYGDIHTIGSLLKKFFQELPDSLIPSDRYKEFLMVVKEVAGETEQVTRLRGLVFHLPTAHYHTLRYLIRHLTRVAEHAEKNKMVLRNVAMVFGPTLMLRSNPVEEFDFVAMNNSFTVIEMLCRHWCNIFDSEMCHEEQVLERQRELEGTLVPSQRTSSDPAVNSLKVKKDHTLINASPRMVRRIKNQFTSGSSRKTPERNSYGGGDALPFSRKQHNRSDTIPQAIHSHVGSLLSPSTPPSKWGRAGSSGTLQTVRHRDGEMRYGGDLNPHSRYMHAGLRDEGRREHTGSIWKKDPQRGRGSVEKGQSRSQMLSSHPPPPPIAHQRELLTTSYQQPSHTLPSHHHSHSTPSSHDLLHRSTTLPASPEHHASLPHHSVRSPSSSHTPSSPSTRRKISYNLAVTEGYQRHPHTSASYQNMIHHHHQRQSSDSMPFAEEIREKEFSHSYAPRSTNYSTGKSESHSTHQSSSGSRGYLSYGPQRGDLVQRSRHNESYH